MVDLIKWVTEHWTEIGTIITSLIGIASIIVKLTPNLKDDTVLQKVIAFIGKYIALNKTVKPEDRPK